MKADNNIGVVLLHGAGLNSMIWKKVQEKLEMPSLAVDFPKRNNKGKKNLKFVDYASSVAKPINQWGISKLGLKVADLFKERAVGIVGMGAAIPANGKSFISCLPFPQRYIMPLVLKLSGTMPPESAIKNGFATICQTNKQRGLSKTLLLNQFCCLLKIVWPSLLVFLLCT
ncbi:hypothetical protein RCC89_14410 [Cytophagaceae bacterium ABcell3]|nr:hypothetical protein RCC89_14410 [Cytophagaceae bacterium ABcell3]